MYMTDMRSFWSVNCSYYAYTNLTAKKFSQRQLSFSLAKLVVCVKAKKTILFEIKVLLFLCMSTVDLTVW